jgi:hypothetical protein
MNTVNQALALRFRARHLLIVVAYFAVLLGILVPVVRYYGSSGMINGSLVILLASPWLLGILVLLVERKGPVKYWAAPLLLSLTAPALALSHDWVIADVWRRTGSVPNAMVSLLVNALLIGTFSLFFASMYPGCCPRCGHRSLIPLLRLWGRGSRTSKTRWCGHCGAQYWRNREGLWQKERRSTWVDALVRQVTSHDGADAPPATTHTRPDAAPSAIRAPRASLSRRPAASSDAAASGE